MSAHPAAVSSSGSGSIQASFPAGQCLHRATTGSGSTVLGTGLLTFTLWLCAVLAAAPYSKLSKSFPRKWLAGYAYDSSRDLVRLYLSTLKPKAPNLPAGETRLLSCAHSDGLAGARGGAWQFCMRVHSPTRGVGGDAKLARRMPKRDIRGCCCLNGSSCAVLSSVTSDFQLCNL